MEEEGREGEANKLQNSRVSPSEMSKQRKKDITPLDNGAADITVGAE